MLRAVGARAVGGGGRRSDRRRHFQGKVYRPGDVVRLNRVWKKDRKLEGAERDAAWQLSWGVSLGVLFIGLPWAWNSAQDVRLKRAAAAPSARDAVQKAVYDVRVAKRGGMRE